MTIAEKFFGFDLNVTWNYGARLKRRQGKKRDIEICKRNLLNIREILNDEDIVFWLMYGTLLGAVRNNSFIEHDTDDDIGFFYESKNNFDIVISKLIDIGFRLCRMSYNDSLVSVIRDDEYTDLCFFRRNNLPFSEFKTINFIGVDFRIPLNAEKLLTDWYGDWKTPVKDKQAIIIYGLDL